MLEINISSNYDIYTTESLTQWDTNQKIAIAGITGTINILFFNRIQGTSEPVNTVYSAGRYVGDIPNGLLAEPYPIIAFVRKKSGNTYNTVSRIKIPVVPSAKPADYEYIDNVSLFTYEDLLAEISSKANDVDLAVERERIDQIVEMGTDPENPDNAELTDIRLGADNVKYLTAGTAVREQLKKIVTFDESGNPTVNSDIVGEEAIKSGSITNEKFSEETTFDYKEVTKISDMKDVKSIYKYIGNELGYITNVLYYHDGEKWKPIENQNNNESSTIVPCQLIDWDKRNVRLSTLVNFDPIEYPGDGDYFPSPYIKNSQNGRIFTTFQFLDEEGEIIQCTSSSGGKVNSVRVQNSRMLRIVGNTIQSRYYSDISDYENDFLYNGGSVESYTFEGTIKYIKFEIGADTAFDSAKYGITYGKPSYEYVPYPYKKVMFDPSESYGVMEQAEEYIKQDILNPSELQRVLKTFTIREINATRDALRIGTFNIYVGRSGYNWPKIKEELQDYGIDICAFQEVADPKGTGRDYNFFTFADTMTGWQFPYCNDNEVVYQKNERMVLSRYEILSSSETVFETEGNERALLKCEIQLPRYKDYVNGDCKISVYTTHLSVSSESNRLAQVDEMLEIINQDSNPFKIICMDSNDFGEGKPVWAKIEAAGFSKAHDGSSMTVTDQSCSIDQIFCSENMKVLNYNVINSNLYKFTRNGTENPVSDHDLLYADIQLDYSDIVN